MHVRQLRRVQLHLFKFHSLCGKESKENRKTGARRHSVVSRARLQVA